MTAIDPKYQAKAAAVTAAREAEAAARRIRRRRCWGPGYTIAELQGLPSTDVRVALNANEQAAVADAVATKTLVVESPAVPPFANRRVKIGPAAVWWTDPFVAHACTLDPTLKAAVEEAETAYLTATGQT